MDCTYHPGRPSVNTCSICGEPVCAGCNYIAGTAPICRNCWEKIEMETTESRASFRNEVEYRYIEQRGFSSFWQKLKSLMK